MAAQKKRRRDWTMEGERDLRAMVRRKMPARRIARVFRRTEGAVRQKVHTLGLSFTTGRRL